MEPERPQLALTPPVRRRVFEAIQREPGRSISDHARALQSQWTSVGLQVARLTADGLVRSVKTGRRRILFTTDFLEQVANAPSFALLAEPACFRVAETIAHRPGERIFEICERLGMSERALYHHVKRLVEAGLVVSMKPGAYRGLAPSPSLVAFLSRAVGSPREIPGPARESRLE